VSTRSSLGAVPKIRHLRGVASDEGGRSAVLDAELLEDMGEMLARSVVADAQQDRDFGTGLALPDERENLGLAIAEPPSKLQPAAPRRDGLAALQRIVVYTQPSWLVIRTPRSFSTMPVQW
jgi:hypothetical protein